MSELQRAQPRGLSVLRALRGGAPRGRVSLVRGGDRRWAAVLRPLRGGRQRRRGPVRRPCGRRAQIGDRVVRRRRGLHVPGRAYRPRDRGTTGRRRLPRVGRDRGGARWDGRQVHGGLVAGGIRRPHRARRRCRAGRGRRHGDAAPRRGPGLLDRRELGRGVGDGDRGRWRHDRHRRHSQRGSTPGEGGRSGRGAVRPPHDRIGGPSDRVPGPATGAAQGQAGAGRGVGGAVVDAPRRRAQHAVPTVGRAR